MVINILSNRSEWTFYFSKVFNLILQSTNIIEIKNSNDAGKINKCKNFIKTLQDAGMKEYSNELRKFIKDNF
ncbi:hypothetical protein CCE30_04765 [Lactobacillus gasseri]|uniref:Uncharacterized protein n=1 Tax=Lactobacillus gasseri TaxID=1596 RepID=A0AB33CB88_LACGS|nr:hypothetical protein CCE30_04765 [Lactobacillus gasseri]